MATSKMEPNFAFVITWGILLNQVRMCIIKYLSRLILRKYVVFSSLWDLFVIEYTTKNIFDRFTLAGNLFRSNQDIGFSYSTSNTSKDKWFLKCALSDPGPRSKVCQVKVISSDISNKNQSKLFLSWTFVMDYWTGCIKGNIHLLHRTSDTLALGDRYFLRRHHLGGVWGTFRTQSYFIYNTSNSHVCDGIPDCQSYVILNIEGPLTKWGHDLLCRSKINMWNHQYLYRILKKWNLGWVHHAQMAAPCTIFRSDLM